MQKTLPGWAFGALSFIGVVLVGSMVLRWVDVGGAFTASGLRLAWDDNHWLFLVPIAGGALLATAGSKSPHTRLAAIFAGIAVTGYVLFNVASSIIHSGFDTWLILGGAGAMLAGMPRDRTLWRAAGGIAVLVGFFAPWAHSSMWTALTSNVQMNGITGNILWLVPLAGIAGIVAAGHKAGAKLTAAAGITIYGTFVFVIAGVAYLVFGLGAWAALGASVAALAIGVLAPAPAMPQDTERVAVQ